MYNLKSMREDTRTNKSTSLNSSNGLGRVAFRLTAFLKNAHKIITMTLTLSTTLVHIHL